MMKRSQIYLPMEQWRLLSMLSHQMHRSISDLIRRALDRVYKQGNLPDFEQSLSQIRGLWAGRDDLGSTSNYLRGLRKGTRLKKI